MDRQKILSEITRAEGVLTAMYGFVRDMVIMDKVADSKDGKTGDVIGDTLRGLNEAIMELGENGPSFCDCCHSVRYNLTEVNSIERVETLMVCDDCIRSGVFMLRDKMRGKPEEKQ